MPTSLGRPYLAGWRGDPPHMLKQDVPVWYRFLDKYEPFIDKLYYDVLLGGPTLTKNELKDPIIRMMRTNNSKRADAIAELSDEIWIIEVAERPGLRAVGQLQVYRSLWIEDPQILKPEKVVLVAAAIDQDLLASAARIGIQTYIV